jgi:hypothetical protein
LIDFESVQPESLVALEHDHFKVLVFVGATQTKIPFELATALQRMGPNGQYIKIAGNGKNALDFHIAYYIGQLAAADPSAYFHIISKDSGFDPLVQHLKTKKIFAARSPSIEDIPLVKSGNKKSVPERAQLFVERLKQPKATRPRTIRTLSSAVGSFFRKQLSETEIASVVAEIQKSGFITVTEGKVSYAAVG